MKKIQVGEIPEEGLVIQGEEPPSVFALEDSSVDAVSPLRYDLLIKVGSEDNLEIEGEISADFAVECVRCLERFEIEVFQEDYSVILPLENRTTIDLTDRIREDILLDLPGYPRCDEEEERECPASGRFLKKEPPPLAETEESGKEVWNALDGFQANEKSEEKD